MFAFNPKPYAPSDSLFCLSSAVIAAGSFAERMKFPSMLIFFFFWHCWVYCPIAHWHWGQGYLARWGVLDFAGGHVVHIVAGSPQDLRCAFTYLV